MNKCQLDLIHYVQSAAGFDAIDKIKIIVFATGLKKAAIVRLKIGPHNMEDKAHFEKHLKQCGALFAVRGPRTFEEISAIKRNRIIWKPSGIWFGYNLFTDRKTKQLFSKYQKMKHNNRHAQADVLGSQIFGYPSCCQRQYSKEHSLNYIRKKYTYYEFYNKTRQTDVRFPFIFHFPCTTSCKKTTYMNSRHKHLVQKYAPRFYENFARKERFAAEVIVDSVSDVLNDAGKSIWKRKDGADTSLITREKISGHHLILSELARNELERGTVFSSRITIQYDAASVVLLKKTGFIKGIHHERSVPQWQ